MNEHALQFLQLEQALGAATPNSSVAQNDDPLTRQQIPAPLDPVRLLTVPPNMRLVGALTHDLYIAIFPTTVFLLGWSLG